MCSTSSPTCSRGGRVRFSDNTVYDIGDVLLANDHKPSAFPHFEGTTEAIDRLLSVPRLCTKTLKTISMEKLVPMYGVCNEHPHDARGGSKSLAQCFTMAPPEPPLASSG